MSEDEAFDRELEALRRATLAAFPDKMRHIADAVSSALALSESDPNAELEAWSTARQLAHSLRGIAGMFGAQDLGTAAGTLEDMIAEYVATQHDKALELLICEQVAKMTSLVGEAQT